MLSRISTEIESGNRYLLYLLGEYYVIDKLPIRCTGGSAVIGSPMKNIIHTETAGEHVRDWTASKRGRIGSSEQSNLKHPAQEHDCGGNGCGRARRVVSCARPAEPAAAQVTARPAVHRPGGVLPGSCLAATSRPLRCEATHLGSWEVRGASPAAHSTRGRFSPPLVVARQRRTGAATVGRHSSPRPLSGHLTRRSAIARPAQALAGAIACRSRPV